ncbi:MAG: thioredoxin domain-containing protein [Chloroflexi bacterium]|nr:thioredoxin domain-containing protein [Chloroflexota bacterium]
MTENNAPNTPPPDNDVKPISLRDADPQAAAQPAPTPNEPANMTVLLVATAVISLVGGLLIAIVFGLGSDLTDDDIDGTVQARVNNELRTYFPDTPTPAPTPTRMPVAMTLDDDAYLGPDDAPVVIVEFSDFQCGFCGRWYFEVLPQILEAYPNEVKFIYRDFPIFGEPSLTAAMATECAEEQGAFWEMHDAIFEYLASPDSGGLNNDAMVSLADDLDLDTDSLATCLDSRRYEDEILADYQTALTYGFEGTPGFVINGQVYPFGAQPFETFDRIIQDELAGSS